MAKFVMGMAAPHSGMLGKAPETWLEDGQRDRVNPQLWYRKNTYSFEELEALRRSENLTRFLTHEELNARYKSCRTAIDTLRRVYAETDVDVAIVLGKDQREIFIDITPTFVVHVTDGIENGPPQRPIYSPPAPIVYPGARGLAADLLGRLQADGFDMMSMTKLPPHAWLGNKTIVPHAYSFIYHEIMLDEPPPSIPVYMNTFYPPTQPSIGRCIEFGRSIAKAVRAWDDNLKVGLFASGGFSHFVVDEELDRLVLDHFRTGDIDALSRMDERLLQSGTSEIKLFVPILVAMMEAGVQSTIVDYVPCYRTEAGTGEGMPFIYWKP